ncbi:DNase I-like protein [Serendipita vermifera]|nr:DNase I-like protein [Serendipita vermifera]
MQNAHEEVKKLLRTSEKVTLVIDTNPGPASSGSTTSPTRNNFLRPTRRVIATVIHEEPDKQVGALFIFKWSRSEPPSLVLVATLAIGPDFEISLAQVSSSALGVPVQPDSIPTAKRPDCLVDVHSEGEELSFMCPEAEAVALREECNRLKTPQATEQGPPEATHSWMAAYSPSTVDRRIISQLMRPADLRRLHHGPSLSTAFAGEPGDEDADAVLIRDDWVLNQVRARKDEYASTHSIRVRIGTFNVNGQSPNASIRSWINGHDEPSERLSLDGSADPDIFIFGFQELDLSTGALLYSTSNLLEIAWTDAIIAALGQKSILYTKFASRQLVGMLILGFVRKGQRPHIGEITTSSLGVGLMGLMGNKGAVGLRFRFRNTYICCIASHLAAGDGFLERRNADYLDICHRLQFPLNAATPAEATDEARAVSCSIFESDVLIWLVNLNYRIDIPIEEVVTLKRPPLKPYNRSTLLEFDELITSKRNGRIFEVFKEQALTFDPTYRYFINTRNFDLRRRPAWTDRILYSAYPFSSIQQLSYQSHPDVTLSDHRPVSADFLVQVNSVDPELHTRTVVNTLRQIKDFNTQSKGSSKLQLSTKQINFGDIRYLEKYEDSFKITNTGAQPCIFRFVSPHEGNPLCPPWLTIDTTFGLLLPNETTTVSLKAAVKDSIAQRLQSESALEATLIIHVEHGLDYFVAVTAHFMPTCFARSIDSLVRLPKSARESGDVPELVESRASTIPKEFMRIIDWLMGHPLNEVAGELFMSHSDPKLLYQIREALDTGEPYPFEKESEWKENDITLAFGETLVHFLRSLPEPLVPLEAHPLIADVLVEDNTEFLDTLPHSSVNVWVTLFAFLQFACIQSSGNASSKEEADRIASVFAPILLRGSIQTETGVLLTPLKKRAFITRFLMM